MQITIPRWRPVLRNEADRMHWGERAKRKKIDEQVIGSYFEGPPAKQKRRVDLHFVLGKGQKRFDGDAPWKNVLDGLVKCGALVDDSSKWCELGSVEFSRGQQATIIKLFDI